jgi:hypothetical protein
LPTIWLLAVVALVALPHTVRADGSWLDASPPVQWNQPGMALPTAPAGSNLDPRCLMTSRPVETDEDSAVVNAGWYLVGAYQSGWGIRIVLGASDFDGMCRPFGFQAFAFVDGAFAGTLSPEPMNSRSDGVLTTMQLQDGGITAQFSRYAPSDPLCCPSANSIASYTIDRSSKLPVVVLTGSSTQPSAPGG